MRIRKLAYLLMVVMAISACQFSSRLPTGSGNATPGNTTSGNTAKYQYISKTPTAPIHLSIEQDKTHSALGIIGPAGGQISTKGADGTFTAWISPKMHWQASRRLP